MEDPNSEEIENFSNNVALVQINKNNTALQLEARTQG